MTMSLSKLPPGKYFIGDPFFVLNKHDLEILLLHNTGIEPSELFIMNDELIWSVHVDCDDGSVLLDQNENEYQIETSAVAAIPINLVDNPEGEEHGTVLDAPDGLEVVYSGETIAFNSIVIILHEPEISDAGYELDLGADEFI